MTRQTREEDAVFLLERGAQITLASIRLKFLCASYFNPQPASVRSAAQLVEHISHEDLKAGECRNRVARQPNEVNTSIFAKGQWFSGSHVHAPEVHFALCFDHFFN